MKNCWIFFNECYAVKLSISKTLIFVILMNSKTPSMTSSILTSTQTPKIISWEVAACVKIIQFQNNLLSCWFFLKLLLSISCHRHHPHQFVNEPRMIMMFSFAFKNSSLIDFNYLNSLMSKLRFLFIAFS